METYTFETDQAQIKASRQGAHLTSWCIDGQEQLYLSPLCSHGEGKAIRGGVPIIFPQFERFGDGPRHGYARTVNWEAQPSTSGLRFKLTQIDEHYQQWPHKADVFFTANVKPNTLTLELTVANVDAKALSFTCALHTYFRVADIARTKVQGLEGLSFWNNDGSDFKDRHIQNNADLMIDKKTDRIYFDAKKNIVISDGERQLSLSSQGFEDAVVWNPWLEDTKSLTDMPDEDYKKMLCVEPARVNRPVTLEPNESWTGKHTITALRP